MKKTLLLLVGALAFNLAFAQQKAPEFDFKQADVESHLRFLASDEMEGRRTGDTGCKIAARYIATQFESYGVKPVGDSYLQPVSLQEVTPPQTGKLSWGKKSFTHGDNLMVLAGKGVNTSTKAVYVGHGWVDAEKGIDDYKGLDVKGKVVVVVLGLEDDQTPGGIFRSMRKKREIAAEKGAVALVELFRMQPGFWSMVTSYFSKPRIELVDADRKSDIDLTYAWLMEGETGFGKMMEAGKKTKVSIKAASSNIRQISSSNVVGIIEGTDPKLKDEYVALTAHYDHVGVGAQGGGATTEQDSIFNGSRDNAFGTVAMLSAAKAFAQNPPKRSMLFIGFTGEEVGLLGSQFYADNPVIPMEKTIFNINCDGAGYNDTDYLTVFGLNRVGAKAEIEAGAGAFGLKVNDDPAPEQGLFDRSDNVSFAAKGVPAPTISPGFSSFDEAIMKYYHQVTDNPDTIDFPYLLRFSQAYTHIARLIADKDARPFWAEGDKYEAVGKELYNKK